MSGAPDITLLIDGLTAEIRTAVLRRDEPVAFSIHPPTTGPRLGDVYAARIRKVGKEGAFADLGDGHDGFLPTQALRNRSLSEGDLVATVVRREGVRGKGCRLAFHDVDADTAETPGLLSAGPGPALERLAALPVSEIARVVVEGEGMHAEILQGADPVLLDRIERHTAATPLFEAFGVEGALQAALEPEIALPGGGRLIVEETTALTAVDVDSGTASAAKTNERAIAAIVDAIGLRGLGGVIMIDPAGSNDRKIGFRMAEALGEAFAAAGIDGEVKGVTRAGLVEVVVRKQRESVAETLKRLRTRAYAAIRAAHGAARHHAGRPLTVRANVDLTELLGREAFAPEFEAFRARHGVDLHLATDNAMARGMFEIEEHGR